MLSTSSKTNPLIIKPRRSRYLAGLLWVFYTGAALFSLLLPFYLNLPLLLLLAFSMYRVWGLYITRHSPDSIDQLMLNGEGEWLIRFASGRKLQDVTLRQSFVHPLLVTLNFSGDGRLSPGHSLVLLPDSLEPECFRQLRVYLRLKAGRLAE